MTIDTTKFFARELQPSGYTWTPVSRLGYLLERAEARFGQRDMAWTLLGVEVGPHLHPQIWFPQGGQRVIAQLSFHALVDETELIYQLAHESVHVLGPSGHRGAPAFEEGVATVFSEDMVEREFGIHGYRRGSFPSYDDAAADVRTLLGIDADVIKKLRAIEPTFQKIDAEHFLSVCPDLPPDLLARLLAPFVRD